MSASVNALRLAFGTLSVLPVPAPQVDRRTAGRAMTLAPLVGLVLAGLVMPLTLLDLSPVLVAALVVGALALLTRGLHLDGLADTADGLGSGRPAAGALEVMRRSDIGPFGVVTLVLTLLVQVAALAQLLPLDDGRLRLVVAVVVSRLVVPLACLPAVPSARPDGLGAAVAGSVTAPKAAAAAALTLALVVLAGALDATDPGSLLRAALVASLGLLAGGLLVRRAVRRLGGITGDVLGAAVETTFTAALVLLCLV